MKLRHQDGFSLIELLIVVGIVGAIAAIAVPGLLKARISADEASAIGSLRAVNSAQASYSSAAGGGGYAVKLATLAAGCGAAGPFISPDLAEDPSDKSGYLVELQASDGASVGDTDCNGNDTYSGFYGTAVPIAVGVSGRRAFATTGGSIFFNPSGIAPTEVEMASGGGALVLR